MNDRELLELAAKAAGYVIEGDADRLVAQPGHFAGGFSILNDRGGSSLWNPLYDDGDALRLTVKLRIDVLQKYEGATFATNHRLGARELQLGDDPYAATRRAIVRAAAEIGKGMK